MPKGRVIVLTVGIAVLSIAVTALILLFVAPSLAPAREAAPPETAGGVQAVERAFDPNDTLRILVAVQRLPRGLRIPVDAVDVREWPVAAVPQDAIIIEEGVDVGQIAREEVEGRIARTDIEREQPILRTLLVDDLAELAVVGSDTAAVLPQGMVAIAVPLDRLSGVAYAIQPGDHVDLIFSMVVVDVDEEFQSALPNSVLPIEYGTFTEEGARTTATVEGEPGALLGRLDTIPPGELANVVPSEPQRPRLVSQRAVEDALVLYVGEYPEDGRFLGVGIDERSASPPQVVTLGMLPQDAVVVTWAINSGVEINLALRSVRDVPDVPTTSVTLQYVVETYNIIVPPRLPYSLEPSLRTAPPTPDVEE